MAKQTTSQIIGLPLLATAVALLLAACPSAPIDALDAAGEALANASSAEDCAPEEYRAAERLYEQARQASADGDYDRALTLARSAEEQAERARLMAQANAEDCYADAQADLALEEASSGNRTIEEIMGGYDLVAVYFSFDDDTLDPAMRVQLEAHAQFLGGNSLHVVVEGHCDHHGTDQYNLALGDSRARSVARFLVTQGVDPARLSTLSYGEFRPASYSDTNLNRRAEFRVRQ